MTDFELQTQSGQLWLEIVARLSAKDAEIASLSAALRECTEKMQALTEAADDPDALAKAIAIAKQTEEDKRHAERQERRAKLVAEIAELDALPADAAQDIQEERQR